ncbi:MAG: DUF4886 domain-containing protein [Bacteroidales bacterium]|nr:DUF4886 domain-containing protein [Candidatus Equibacterium intestinale]
MKRLFLLTALLIAVSFDSSACRHHAEEPVKDGVLRILAIGNSFTDDGVDYLPAILENLGIKNVELVSMYIGGCTVERHVKEYESESPSYIMYVSKAGVNSWTRTDNVTLQDALDYAKYDIVVTQQASPFSGLWDSYRPWIDKLVEYVRLTQPDALWGWQMTWSYSAEYMADGRFTAYGTEPQNMFKAICGSVNNLLSETPYFTYLIPSAVAIDNVRNTELSSAPLEMTRDGFHIDLGAGRYTLAMTWYQTLIYPYTGIGVTKNDFSTGNGNVKVDDQTRPVCIKAVTDAMKNYKKVIRKNSK